MKKGRDRRLLGKPGPGREIERVDPAEVVVGCGFDRFFDRVDGFRIGALPQQIKQIFGVAHDRELSAAPGGDKPRRDAGLDRGVRPPPDAVEGSR